MLRPNLISGFSLIEVLISIALLAVLTLSMISVLAGGNSRLNLLTKIYKEQSLPLDAFALLDWDFTHFYSPLFVEKWIDKGKFYNVEGGTTNVTVTERMIATDRLNNAKKLFYEMKNFIRYTINDYLVPNYFGEENRSLTFLTMSYRPRSLEEKKSFFHWVQYACKEKKFIRKSLPIDPFRQSDLDFTLVPEEVLLENLERCEFDYWYVMEKDFINNIEPLSPPSAFILRAIRLRIVYEQKFYERIFRPLQERMSVEEESNL